MLDAYLDADAYPTRLNPVLVPVPGAGRAHWLTPGFADGRMSVGFVRQPANYPTVYTPAEQAQPGDIVVAAADLVDVAELTRTEALPYGVRYSDAAWYQHKGRNGASVPTLQALALVAEREVKLDGHRDEAGQWVPPHWKVSPGRHVLAVVMPMRLPTA
jgi:hypothetical protein